MELYRSCVLLLAHCGIRRAGFPIAARPNGDLVLRPGYVVAEDGDLILHSSLVYELEEPFPKILFLGGHLLVERLPVLKDRTRRCLLLTEANGSRELWLYFEPERVWGVTLIPAGCSAAR